jgi:hypothetical protein
VVHKFVILAHKVKVFVAVPVILVITTALTVQMAPSLRMSWAIVVVSNVMQLLAVLVLLALNPLVPRARVVTTLTARQETVHLVELGIVVQAFIITAQLLVEMGL